MKGSQKPNREKVGKINQAQIEEIAKRKQSDMNVRSLRSAKRMVAGTARSMGIDSEEEKDDEKE